MKVECYNHWHDLPKSAGDLFDHVNNESMFITREWFETLYDVTFKNGQTLLLVCVLDNNNVAALLPIVEENGHWQSLKHRYTSFFNLLLAKDNKAEIITCLAKGLNQIPIYSLNLNPVAENDNQLLALQKALEIVGYQCHKHFLFYNWIHQVRQQSFKEYLNERPAILRNTIKRKRRKLEREHDYKINMFQGEHVKQGLIDYHSAYSASWKANEQQIEFLDAVAINLSTPNWTRLAVLTIDGKAAAAQLWFVVEDKANIFRLAYNEKWKHYSPGSILTAYLMEHVIDIDKVKEIDFLTGNEAYKQDWMSERRQRWSMTFVKQRKIKPKSKKIMAFFKNTFKKLNTQ